MWSKIEESLEARLLERSESLRSRFLELLTGIDVGGMVEVGKSRNGDLGD